MIMWTVSAWSELITTVRKGSLALCPVPKSETRRSRSDRQVQKRGSRNNGRDADPFWAIQSERLPTPEAPMRRISGAMVKHSTKVFRDAGMTPGAGQAELLWFGWGERCLGLLGGGTWTGDLDHTSFLPRGWPVP